MKSRTRFLLLLLVVCSGIGITFLREGFTGKKNEEKGINRDAGHTDYPRLDFPLLDEARSLDLIEMELDFPESLRELDGQRVSLIGFMAPFDNLQNMQRCMIVPSYVGCTFCSPPSMSQVVFATQGDKDDTSRIYPFIEEPSYVTGTLRLALPESDHEGKQQGFLYYLEDAVITAHRGDVPERNAAHQPDGAGPAAHQPDAPLIPVEMPDLVAQVAELIGKDVPREIEVEIVSGQDFEKLLRSELEQTFPEPEREARTQAFTLLGMIPEDADWLATLASRSLTSRVALSSESGERIHLVSYVSPEHPYVRLGLVAEITKAILRQHYPLPGHENEDARRAHEALREGIEIMAVYRYARNRGISPAVQPPSELDLPVGVEVFASIEFELWQSLPRDVGPFFVDFLVGATGPMTGVEPALSEPPSTTMEFFRPRWFEDQSLWKRDPVPRAFADDLLDTPPVLTDVFGLGGLVPWLAKWYPINAAKGLVGQWAGDRWALWQLPDGASALVLETRWQDEDAALQFRNALPEEPEWALPPHEDGSSTVRLIRTTSPQVRDRLVKALQVGP